MPRKFSPNRARTPKIDPEEVFEHGPHKVREYTDDTASEVRLSHIEQLRFYKLYHALTEEILAEEVELRAKLGH